jgi:transcriptional regulator with XRE-family HTH domain
MRRQADPEKADVGRAVVFLAASLGLSQSMLAARAGLSNKTISDWCRGISRPDRRSMESVLKVLGCTEAEVWEATRLHREWRLRMERKAGADSEVKEISTPASSAAYEHELGLTAMRFCELIVLSLKRKSLGLP